MNEKKEQAEHEYGEKRRQWLRALLSSLVIAAMTVSILGCLTKIVGRKDSYHKYKSFFQQTAGFDVLFLGSSHTIGGVFPMELWNDYGMVSYNFGGSASSIPCTYWLMENALDHTTPRLVVLDCFYLSSNEMFIDQYREYYHESMDMFPLSRTKLDTVRDLFGSLKEGAEFVWGFSSYHNRWSEVGMDDIAPSVWPEKGACSLVAVAENAVYAPVDGSRAMRDDTVGVEYLKKAIESCQSRGIDVLLTYIPFAAAEEWQLEANRVPEIAAEYGVDYIDFLDLGVIDYDVDCSDAGSHINPSGARKVTEYLGRYIMDRYDIPDRRGDPDYANWYDDYKTYTQFKIDVLVGQTDVKRYLMLLQDKHLSSILYLAPSELWHGDSIYEKLLANMGIESEKLNTDRPTLAVVDNKAGTVSYLAPGEETDASFGRLAFVQGEGAYQAVLDGAVQLEMTDQTMGAAVVNNATDSIVTTSMFTASTATSFTKVA